MKIHCLACRKNFDAKADETKLDSGFESHKCPLCGYENTIERDCGCAPGRTKEGDK